MGTLDRLCFGIAAMTVIAGHPGLAVWRLDPIVVVIVELRKPGVEIFVAVALDTPVARGGCNEPEQNCQCGSRPEEFSSLHPVPP